MRIQKQVGRDRIDSECVRRYLSKIPCAQIAKGLGIHEETVRRKLRRAGVTLRDWSRSHGIVDGKKVCKICDKAKDVTEFYKRSDYDGYYSYCKECDTNRAVRVQKRNRMRRVQARTRVNAELTKISADIRTLLRRCAENILQEYPSSSLAAEALAKLHVESELLNLLNRKDVSE